MLRSSEDQVPAPQSKSMGDIEELAASYERKLIEVSAVPLSARMSLFSLYIDGY